MSMYYDYKNKNHNIQQLNNYMLARTLTMFVYDGLPETLSGVELEKQLQQYGFAFITQTDYGIYSFVGSFGGELDAYYNPTKITITNPHLPFNQTLDVNTDGVLITNDDMMLGVLPLFNKYNSLLIENEITMYLNSFNERIQTLLSAGDDTTRESAEKYLQKIEDGELGIIGENRLFDGVISQNTQSSQGDITTSLIEFNQYLRATLNNEMGIDANFNMKRERLNSSEVEMNEDSLYPLVHNMLKNRVDGVNKLNDFYGTNVVVDFGSIWKKANEQPTDDEQNEPDDEPTEPTESIETTEPDDEPTEQQEQALQDYEQTVADENINYGEEISENEEEPEQYNEPTEEVTTDFEGSWESNPTDETDQQGLYDTTDGNGEQQTTEYENDERPVDISKEIEQALKERIDDNPQSEQEIKEEMKRIIDEYQVIDDEVQ